MKKNNFFATLLAIYLFSFFQLFGQLSISTIIEPPYPKTLADKESFEDDQLQITIINNQDRSFNVRFGLTLENLANPDAINLSTNGPVGDCFIIDPGDTELTLADFEGKNISFNDLNIPEKLVQNPEFPEGTYKFCVTLYDCNNSETQLTNTGEGCAFFTINKADAPIITYPNNITEIRRDIDELDITWMFNKPAEYNGGIKYRVQIVGLDPPETDPKEAFANEPQYLFDEEVIDEMIATFESPDFGEFKKCAIIVRAEAEDINDNLLVRDNGFSEVQTFNISTEDDFEFKTASTFSPHYPYDEDVIPFNFFPIVVEFQPYSEEYKRHEFKFKLENKEEVIFDITDSFKWPEGPRTAQHNLLVKNCGFSKDINDFQIGREQLLAYNKKAGTSPNVFKHLKDSSFYSWNLDASFRNKPNGGGEIIKPGSASGTFKMGMQSPELKNPADNKIIKPGEVNFRFFTSIEPRKLLPEYYIRRANAEDDECVFFDGYTYEKCRLEVDTSAEFKSEELLLDTIYTIGSKTEAEFKFSSLYKLKEHDEKDNSAIISFKEKVYKDLTKAQAFTKPDTYYWRVGWLTEPDIENNDYYAMSEIWKFIIKDSTASDTTDIPETPSGGECIAVCEISEPSSTGSTEITINSKPLIGLFTLNISNITGSESGGYSGEGWINIPFLNNVDVLVTFSDVKANSDSVIYTGTVVADKDHDFNLSILENSAVSNVLNFADVNKEEINNKLQEPARWISLINDKKMALPLALDKTIGGETFLIGLMDMQFKTSRASMKVVMNADLPFGGEVGDHLLSFGSEICFAPNGLGEEGIMYRIEDLDITPQGGYDVVIKGIGDATSLDTSKTTYLNWDCKGFKTIQIAGEVVFPREDLLPVNEQGVVIEGNEKVKATFRTSYTRGVNIIAAATFNHPFQHTSLEDWTFQVTNAFYDRSDLENPPNIIFPEDFEDESVFEAETKNLWKGIFIQDISVIVHERFKKFNQTGKLNFAAKNVFYDETGFTADIKAENIINYPEGNLDGWQYSMDTLNLKWVSNNFRKGRIDGKIHIVGFDSTEYLTYYALLNREEVTIDDSGNTDTQTSLEFITKPNKDIDYRFSSIKSTLLLEDDSAIKVTYAKQSGWDILATLNGSLTLDSNLSNTINKIPTVDFKGIKFRGFQLGNKKGFETGEWSLASPPKFLGGFPVNLSNVEMKMETDDGVRLGLAFDLNVNIAKVVSATSNLTVWGKINMPESSHHIMKFDGVDLNKFNVDGTVGPVHITGELETFKDDLDYGNGFKGQIEGRFDIGNGFDAGIQFYSGRISDYRYWSIDVSTSIPPTPIFAGLDLIKVGGGVYYNMKMTSTSQTNHFSSSTFLPQKNTFGLGLAARVVTQGDDSKFNADARLTVELDSTFSINTIDFRGMGFLMAKVNERGDAQIEADLKLKIDFANSILSGSVDGYVNVKNDWLKGDATAPTTLERDDTEGYVGSASMYFDAGGTWSILVGTPATPISLSLKGLATSKSYFMIGSSIPEVTFDSYGGGVSTSGELGEGIAFGSDLTIGPFEKTYLVFYGKFEAHIKYDVALQNKSNVVCAEADGAMGINGWYAEGQFSTRFDGAVGIKVKIFGASGKYEIIKVGGGVDLQAKLPNPSYFMGYVSGKYSLLNGAISGYCNFKIELGDKCTDPNAPPVGFAAIGSVGPSQGEETEVYTFPQASFNIAMDTPIELYDDEGKKQTFRAKIDKFQIKQNGNLITQNYFYNSEKTVATIQLEEWLTPKISHSLYIAVKWQEKVNGSWNDVKHNGSVYLETKQYNFKTKTSPDHIPNETVVVTYPLDKQRFYLQNEYNRGIVSMTSNPNFTETQVPTEYIARLIKLHPVDTIDIGPVTIAKDISFNLPPLENSKIYSLELVRRKISQGTLRNFTAPIASAARLNSTTKEIFSAELNDGTSLVQRTNVLEGKTLGVIPEKVIYKYHFKTSKYNTLSAKLAAMSSTGIYYKNNEDKELLALFYSMGEGFDRYDLKGWEGNNPLISFSTKWETTWHPSLWMGKINRKILDCAESKLGLELGTPGILENAVTVNEGYEGYPLLEDTEIESSLEVTRGNRGGVSGLNLGNNFYGSIDVNKNHSIINGVDLSKLSYNLMLASSNPISRLSNYNTTYSAFAFVGSSSSYGVSSSTSTFSSSSLILVTPYSPGGGGNLPPSSDGRIPSIDTPTLVGFTSFFIKYKTSLEAYNIYRNTWHTVLNRGYDACSYFSRRNTTVNRQRKAPGFFRITSFPGTYKISSSYNLKTIFNNQNNNNLINRLNFEIE